MQPSTSMDEKGVGWKIAVAPLDHLDIADEAATMAAPAR